MKDLAQAISALINSSPRSPSVDEIEAVVRKHVPEAPSDAVTRIASDAVATALPDAVATALRQVCHRPGRAMRLSDAAAADLSGYVTPNAIVLYTRNLLLLDPREHERDIRGRLLKPPRVYAVCYNPEYDRVHAHLLVWEALQVLAPQAYETLMHAWQKLQREQPTP